MTHQPRRTRHVRGGRQLIGETPRATLAAPLHPIAQEAEDVLLHSTDSGPGTPRRVAIVRDGVGRMVRTSLSDDDIRAIAASLGGTEEPPPRPGHADLGEDPFESAVAKAVAAHLERLGLDQPRAAAIHGPQTVQALHGYPAARRNNRHLKLATDFAWDEPADGTALLSSRTERYLQFIEAKELTYGYVKEHEAAFRVLLEVVGDKPTGKLSVNDMDDVLDAIAGMPKFFGMKAEYRDLSIPDMVKKAARLGAKPRQLDSQQRLVTVLRTFFIWLESRNEVRPGLLLGVKLFHPGKDFGGQRDWFDLDDIKVMFYPRRDALFVEPWQTWPFALRSLPACGNWRLHNC